MCSSSRQVVRSELSQNPELIARVAHDAVEALQLSARHVRVRVNPDDYPPISMPLVLAPGGVALDTGARVLNITAPISGAGQLVKNGSGSLILGGDNFCTTGFRDLRPGLSLKQGLGRSAERVTPVLASARAPFCMMGVCFECLVTIDGMGSRQACLVEVREGMRVGIDQPMIVLAPLLAGFRQLHPRVSVELEATDGQPSGLEGFDLTLFGAKPGFDAEVIARPIMETDEVLVNLVGAAALAQPIRATPTKIRATAIILFFVIFSWNRIRPHSSVQIWPTATNG